MRIELLDAEIFVYGSRARGDHRETSDVDLMLVAPNAEPQALLRIHWALMESRIEHRTDVRATHLVAPEFLAAIRPEMVPLD